MSKGWLAFHNRNVLERMSFLVCFGKVCATQELTAFCKKEDQQNTRKIMRGGRHSY